MCRLLCLLPLFLALPACSRTNSFAAEEEAVLAALRERAGPDVQVVRWGPHWRVSAEDANRFGNMIGPGTAMVRVVFQVNGETFDRIVVVSGGQVPPANARIEVPGVADLNLPGDINPFGDDWVAAYRRD